MASELLSGTLDATPVVLVGGGVGKVNAAMTATPLPTGSACTALVFGRGRH
ncbi:MAG: hypothetical protein R3D25_05100 [Geminicoccaceae bacterium]